MCHDCDSLSLAELDARRAHMQAAMLAGSGDSPSYPWLNAPLTQDERERAACFYSYCVRRSTAPTLPETLGIWRHSIRGTTYKPTTGSKFYETDGTEMVVVGLLGEMFFAVGRSKHVRLGYIASVRFVGTQESSAPRMPLLTPEAMDSLLLRFSAPNQALVEAGQSAMLHLYPQVIDTITKLLAKELYCAPTTGGILHELRGPLKASRAWHAVRGHPYIMALERDMGMSSISQSIMPMNPCAEIYFLQEQASDASGDPPALDVDETSSPLTSGRVPLRLAAGPAEDEDPMCKMIEDLCKADRAQRAAMKEKIRRLEESHRAHVAELAATHEAELAETRMQLDTIKAEAIDELETEHDAALKAKDAEHAEHVKRLREEMDAERREHKRVKYDPSAAARMLAQLISEKNTHDLD
jgi:hypothetical protein